MVIVPFIKTRIFLLRDDDEREEARSFNGTSICIRPLQVILNLNGLNHSQTLKLKDLF